mmetsp:Transcript_11506/g.35440  ORF Transcript_11506/g.35440 Transcript_11506/m.35440 type:complete len:175 (+) Transcript_11506:585-1109(+)
MDDRRRSAAPPTPTPTPAPPAVTIEIPAAAADSAAFASLLDKEEEDVASPASNPADDPEEDDVYDDDDDDDDVEELKIDDEPPKVPTPPPAATSAGRHPKGLQTRTPDGIHAPVARQSDGSVHGHSPPPKPPSLRDAHVGAAASVVSDSGDASRNMQALRRIMSEKKTPKVYVD